VAAGVSAIACVVDNVESVACTSEDAWTWAAPADCCATLLWAGRELPAETFVVVCVFCVLCAFFAFLAFSLSFSFSFRASLAE